MHARAPRQRLDGALHTPPPSHPFTPPSHLQVRLANGSTVAFTASDRAAVLNQVAEMAARPLRCLAMAIKEDLADLADYDGK